MGLLYLFTATAAGASTTTAAITNTLLLLLLLLLLLQLKCDNSLVGEIFKFLLGLLWPDKASKWLSMAHWMI